MATKKISDRSRFWSKVNRQGPIHPVLGTRCWPWKAGTFKGNGYGQFFTGSRTSHSRKNHRSHKYAWEILKGPVPDGLQVCHHCDNRLCCRPEHLFLGTIQDNMEDRNSKGRQAKGTRVNTNVLTEEQAVEVIRWKPYQGETLKQLAKRLDCSVPALNHIRAGHNWKHLARV